MENINPEMVRNRMNRKTHSDIIPRMFLSAAVAMIFTRLTSVAAQIITSERHSGIDFFLKRKLLKHVIHSSDLPSPETLAGVF